MRAASRAGFAALAVPCAIASCAPSPGGVEDGGYAEAGSTADGGIGVDAAIAGDAGIAGDAASAANGPDGACPTPCTGDTTCCGGTCTDLRSDETHCGSCSTSCAGSAMQVCAAGQCGAVDWALWPMPNGKDDTSAGAPNPAAYLDNMDGTVTDLVTHLMWQQHIPTTGGPSEDGNLSWAEASEYCATLSEAGHDDWRLPSQIELVSLLDYSNLGAGQPPINSAFFPDTPADAFWSSTKSAASETSAWTVYMDVGFTYAYDMGTVGRVRCVR
jgi:hypothetical protein